MLMAKPFHYMISLSYIQLAFFLSMQLLFFSPLFNALKVWFWHYLLCCDRLILDFGRVLQIYSFMHFTSLKFQASPILFILQVLLHEGGTLLVCLNSVRALNEPTWSWVQDLEHLISQVREFAAHLLKRQPPSSTIQAAPL